MAASSPIALSTKIVDERVAAQRAELDLACADDLARGTTRDFQLMFEIDGEGRVIDAAAAGGGSAERPLRQCVERHIRKWTFPPPDEAPKTLSATLSF